MVLAFFNAKQTSHWTIIGLLYMELSIMSDRALKQIFLLLIFFISMIFFTVVHPITIISGDDWNNFSISRPAYPTHSAFNPIKVVPETLMPYAGYFASFILKPLGIDYLFAIAITTALLISGLLVIFFKELYQLLNQYIGVRVSNAIVVCTIYFLYIFGMFKVQSGNENLYLLWEVNITCYYHYVVPALMNAALTIFLMRTDVSTESLKNKPAIWVGMLVLSAYLCIFSSIFHSLFLTAFCAVRIAQVVIFERDKIISKTMFYSFIVVMFIVSALFEMKGARASEVNAHELMFFESMSQLWSALASIAKVYRYFLIISLIVGAFTFFRYARDQVGIKAREIFWSASIAGIITFAGLMAICAKAAPWYATRPAAMWGLYMYIMLCMSVSVAYWSNRYRFLNIILPFLVLVMINKVMTPSLSLKESHNLNLSYAKASAITNNLISQVINADKQNAVEMTLQVPKIDGDGNWPFSINMGPVVSETLWADGIISRRMTIHVNPSSELSKEFGVH